MSDDAKSSFLNALVGQEPAGAATHYKEYRAMLDAKLTAAERKVKSRWRWTLGMWVVTAVLFLGGAVAASGVVPIQIRPMGMSAMLLGYGLFYLSLLRLFMFLVFERRIPETVRNESRDAILLELSRKVDALGQHLLPTPEKTILEISRKVEALEQRLNAGRG
jgi:hypothetical protein